MEISLTDALKRHNEVFEQATVEPVLLTEQSRPSHVLMSYQTCQHLLQRLTELEDLLWG